MEFKTKTCLARDMIAGRAAGGAPFGWVAGDEVCGRSSKLRAECEDAGKGYVFAIPVSFQAKLPFGRKLPVASLVRLIPAAARETRSCGPGCKGHRDCRWAWAATCSPRHWVLLRHSTSDPSELSFFYCHHARGQRHPPVRLSLVPLAAPASGPRPMAPLPGPASGFPGMNHDQVTTGTVVPGDLGMPPGLRRMAPPFGSRPGALAPLQRPKSMPGLRRPVRIRRPVTATAAQSRWPKDPSGEAARQ